MSDPLNAALQESMYTSRYIGNTEEYLNTILDTKIASNGGDSTVRTFLRSMLLILWLQHDKLSEIDAIKELIVKTLYVNNYIPARVENDEVIVDTDTLNTLISALIVYCFM